MEGWKASMGSSVIVRGCCVPQRLCAMCVCELRLRVLLLKGGGGGVGYES